MTVLQSFDPTYGSGITETASTTSAPYVIDTQTTTGGGGSKNAVVSNQSATIGVYFRIGEATASTAASLVATDADYYLPPGAQVCVTKSGTDNYIAILSASSTAAVHVIVGEGF